MNRNTRYLLLLLTLFLTTSSTDADAQAPLFVWQKCLGSPYVDYGNSITPTSDGGSISVGYVSGSGGDVTGFFGIEDYWVVKQDGNGVVQWSTCLGGAWEDMGSVVHQLADGTYLVAGEEWSVQGSGDVTTVNHGGLDAWVVKLSATGTILSENSYGGGSNEYVGDVKPTADGGFILVGSTELGTDPIPGNHGDYDIWVMKVNANGSMAWQQCIGGSQDDWGYGVAIAPDGYVVSGWTSSTDGNSTANHGSHDMMAAKLDLNGNLLWANPLGGSGYDEGYGVATAPDGSGYLFAGLTRSDDGIVVGNHGNPGDQDAWVVKLAPNGSFLWQHCYGGSFNEQSWSITNTADGGFLVAGAAESTDGDVSCMPPQIPQMGTLAGWVFKINATGSLVWDKVVSGDYYDFESVAQEASDGSILICGYTCLSDIPGYHKDVTSTVGDIYVGKLSPVTPAISVAPPPANLCSGSTVTLTATFTGPTTGVTYDWFLNNADQGPGTTTISSAKFHNGDQLYCQASFTDGSCTAPILVTSNIVTLSISTTFAPAINITGEPAAVCAGMAMAFNSVVTGGSGSGTYQWLVNGNPAGSGGNSATYNSTTLNDGDLISCVYSDATTCVVQGQIVSNVIAAQVNPNVDVSIQIVTAHDTICAGTTVTFTSTVSGAGNAPGYQWLVNGAPATGSGNTFVSFTLANQDAVSCMLTSNAACASPDPAGSNTVVMTVKPILNAGVNLGYAPQTICSGKQVWFTATVTDAGASPVYQWTVNGTSVAISSDGSGGSGPGSSFSGGPGGSILSLSTLVNGDVVAVTVSDSASCVIPADASATVVVNQSPTVGGGGTVLISKGQSYTMNLSVSGNIAGYNWTPGTWLSDSTIADPVATPLASTEYTLTVVSPEGCTASDSMLVKVFSKLAIPNAFSPNGDGRNDVFYVIGGPIGSKIGDLAVYDRWGQSVFAVHDVAPDDPSYGWNGNIGGRPAPPGTYVYFLRLILADGTEQVVKGTVILVR